MSFLKQIASNSHSQETRTREKSEKKKIKKGIRRRRAAALFSAFALGSAALALPIGLHIVQSDNSGTSGGVIYKVADPQTDTLREPDNTSLVGRVITDKTVRTKAINVNDTDTNHAGKEGTLDIGDDFQVTFSALSSGQQITGEATVPADVVFVLDLSASMRQTTSDGTTRYAAMISALNDSIDAIIKMHPNNRIGVIGYSDSAQVLMPLATYSQRTNKDYFSARTGNNSTVIVTANATNSSRTIGNGSSSSSGTNTESGLHAGMDMLLKADAQYELNGQNYTRTPGLILMSDGQPTYVTNTIGSRNLEPAGQASTIG